MRHSSVLYLAGGVDEEEEEEEGEVEQESGAEGFWGWRGAVRTEGGWWRGLRGSFYAAGIIISAKRRFSHQLSNQLSV